MRTAVIACLVSAVLFGASTPAAKHLLGALSPFTLAGFLYLGAALATAPFALRGGALRALRSASRPNRVRLVLAVFFGGAVGPVLMLLGLSRAPAASVSLWLVLETVATTALAGLLFREHLGARVWAANVLVVAAGILLAAPDDLATLPAALLVAAACVAWGLDNNLTSVIDDFTPAQITLVKGGAAGTANLALGLALDGGAAAGAQTHAPGTILLALAAGALGYGASLVLYVRGAQHLGASRSQMLFATAPFFGAGIAWLALAEPVLPIQLAAAVPMIAGLALLLGERHEHPHSHVAQTHTHDHRHDDGHHTHVHRGLPAWVRHTHQHDHDAVIHAHAHQPDLHHRHDHHE